MKIGSLFSGIGGLELGLEWAGIGKTAWQVEQGPFCQRKLAKHWPHVPRYDDVRTVGSHNLETVDVLCGGFPCQPHSTAGRRRGAGDERDLWGEFARIIGELKPRYVIGENVPGLLTSDEGRFFDGMLADLSALGYDAEWDCVSACAVGAAHARERLFLVAYPTGQRQSQSWVDRENPCHIPPTECWQANRLVDAVRRGTLPFLCREDHGVPERVERLTALGNAVVPQVAWLVGILLREMMAGRR